MNLVFQVSMVVNVCPMVPDFSATVQQRLLAIDVKLQVSDHFFSLNYPPLFRIVCLAVTPCQPNPCQNGGICTPQGNTFSCQCPSTFTGRCCEIRITTTTPYDPCRQSPCRNGGTCIPTGYCVFLFVLICLIKFDFFS